MSHSYGAMKTFSCCRKNGICLKIWILIFVCSLLCFTCLMVENHRSNSNQKRIRNSKHGSQKLIQIMAKAPNTEEGTDSVEESSGYDMEIVNFNPNTRLEEPFINNRVADDVNRIDMQPINQEMSAASNCISKSDNTFSSPQNVAVIEVEDYDYRDFVEDVEKLLEYPVFSETQAEDVLLDCNTLSEIAMSEEHQHEDQWQNNLNQDEMHLSDIEHENEAIFQLPPIVKDSAINNWDLEDRFFPDEYAFQMEPSTELSSAEFVSDYQNNQEIFNNNLLKEVPIQNVDIPAIIDTFLGRISTFLVPPATPVQPYLEVNHFKNLRDNKFSGERMKLSSSKVSPVWAVKPTASRNFPRKPFRPTINANSYAHSKRSFYGNNNRNYGRFFQQLLGINENK